MSSSSSLHRRHDQDIPPSSNSRTPPHIPASPRRSIPRSLEPAYGACVALARAHYENFPVASWLLPAAMRPHVAAVYAYARVADDIADEGTLPAAERLIRLDAWQRRLHAAVELAGEPPHENDDLIVLALAHSIRT